MSIRKILIPLLFFAQSIHAQEATPFHQVMFQLGGGLSSPSNHLHAAIFYRHPSFWGIGLESYSFSFESDNLPANYLPGICIDPFPCTPQEKSNILQLSFYKSITIKENLLHLNLSGGPILVSFHEQEFRPNPNPGLFESNYYNSEKINLYPGIGIHPQLVISFSRVFGISFGTFFLLEKNRNYGGLDLNLAFGFLRSKRDL